MKVKYLLITLLITVFIGMSNQDVVSAPFLGTAVLTELSIEYIYDPAMECLQGAYDSFVLAVGMNAIDSLMGGLSCIMDSSLLCVASELISTITSHVTARDGFQTQAQNCLAIHGPVCGPLPSWFPT